MNLAGTPEAMGPVLAAMFFLAGIILGLVEVPTLCSCYEFCKVVAKYTRVLGGFWVARAGVNIFLASGLLALAVHRIVSMGAILYVPGVCFAHLSSSLYTPSFTF